MCHEHERFFFFKEKKNRERSSHQWLVNVLSFLIQDFIFWYVKIKPTQVSVNMKFDYSQRKIYEHARIFLTIKYLYKKKSASAHSAHFRAHV